MDKLSDLGKGTSKVMSSNVFLNNHSINILESRTIFEIRDPGNFRGFLKMLNNEEHKITQ